jgi:hypothetical protein
MKEKILTRSINTELLDELINSGKLIEDEELAKELLSLIEPEVLKKLSVVEKAPDKEPEQKENTEKEEKKVITDEEKEKILKLIEAELQQAIKEDGEEKE